MSGDLAERVVFIDDEEDVRRANRQSLELDGFAVETFETAEAALAAIRAEPPGVVVTDVRLPGMDGRALFERVRAADPDLPVILITGHGDIPMAVAAIAPWPLGLTGPIYGVASIVLTGIFALLAVLVATRRQVEGDAMKPEKRLFSYSILYLFVIFGALVMALLLGALVLLTFAISIAKIQMGMGASH